MKPKLIYLAARRPGMSRSAFVERWRQHAALGMSQPRWINVERYVHCDVLRPSELFPDISDEYDGVGMIWHRSRAHRRAHLANTTSRKEMETDEARTFARPIVECCLLAQEHEIYSAPTADTPARKLFRFARFSDAMQNPELRDQIMMARGTLVGRKNGPSHYCLNLPIDPQTENRATWGLSSGAVEEFWFEDEHHLGEFYKLFAQMPVLASELDAITMITDEIVLHSKPCDRLTP